MHMLSLFPLFSIVSDGKSAANCIDDPLHMMSHFFLATFKIFLFVFVFKQSVYNVSTMNLFGFIFLGIHLTSWVCTSMIFIIFGKFSYFLFDHYFSKYSFYLFLFIFFWGSHYVYVSVLDEVPWVSEAMVFFLNSSFFSVFQTG